MRRGTRRGPILIGVLLMATMLPFAAPVAAVSTTLVINEVDYDQPSTDTAEFLELKKVGATAANLADFTVQLVNGASGLAVPYVTIPLSGTLAAGDYYVICANNTTTANCDLDVAPNIDLIQNGGPDAIGLRQLGTLIDAVSYEGNTLAPYTEGSGTGLEDNPANATDGISRCIDGSDTDANNVDFQLRAITPGAANNCPAVANLVINEVDYDQPGTDAAEFLELKNVGATAANMADFTVELVNGVSGAAVYQTISPTGTLAAGDYFVICASNVNTVNCDMDVSPDTNLIQNGPPDAVGLRRAGLLVDAVSYEGNTGAPYTEGSGVGLDDNGVSATEGISRCPDGSDTNVNNADFLLRTITPGGSNNCPTGDVAPEVSSTNPTTGATGVPVNSNIEITFSEAVNVTGSWYTINCSASGVHTAGVSGGPITFTLNPDSDFAEVENCGVSVHAAFVTDQDAADPPDNMLTDYTFAFDTAGDVCNATYTHTYSIQGSGTSAAITGNVTTQGVVVGDFEGPTSVGLQGFFIQDVAGDGNPATSDGLFVFRGNTDSALDVGDVVRVNGTVSEFNAQTQVAVPGSLVECGTASVPAVIDVNLPQATSTELERYEGMRVRFPQSLVISEYFEYEQFGEVVLGLPVAGEDRLFTPTHLFEPGSPAGAARQSLNQRSQVRLYDGLANSNPTSLRHPDGSTFSLTNYFRGGDTVANAVGILGERTSGTNPFPRYRIEPMGPATYTAVNPRPTAPDDTDGRVTVAAQNTLNFFLTLDTTTSDSGPGPCGGNANLDCRGADSDQPLEFDRQRDKLLATLAGIGADVIGLNEIENTPGVSPLGDPADGIVAGLNDLLGAGTYDFIDTGVIGTDAIRVGLIYKPGVVTPVGNFEILDSSDDPRFIDTRSRPVLAQTFEENATGSRFTVAVNHLKSKGSACAGDPDIGDGSGNCNGTRTLAAQALVDWLEDDPTGSGDPDFLIVGDLNSYAMEDPIDAIKAGSDDLAGTGDDYTNLVSQFLGTYAYSYVFDAQNGYLDHALSSSTLTSQVTGVVEWHNNADEADIFDYDTTFKPPTVDALYEAEPYRSSDHDSIIVGLDLDAAPVITSLTGTSPVLVNTSASFSASWTDVNDDDTFSTTWDWGDTSADTVHASATSPDAAAHTYTAAGFYTVTFTVTDSTGRSDTETLLVIVYDPAAGKVTGSGTYAGGGSFSLSAKYNPSATAITGTSSFSAPGVTFVTTSTDWLVVSGNRGTYAGTGTYNGTGGYKFLIAVSDGGSPGSNDRVRFQVSDSGGNVVYDTQPGDPIYAAPTTTPTSGNVTVHH